MVQDRDEWLALTLEQPLETAIPILDAHQHFWHVPPGRRPFPRYLLDDYLADIEGNNVIASVFVEARTMYRADGPEELKPVGEVEFGQGYAAACASGTYGNVRCAAAIVGHATLDLGESVRPVLEALQEASPNRFRGIRQTVNWDPHPEIQGAIGRQQQLSEPQFRAGARVLSRMGLSLDISLFFTQLTELAEFAAALPDLNIAINHLGIPLRYGPYANRDEEVMDIWRRGMAAVAECENLYLKLGGIGNARSGFDWQHRTRPVGSDELARQMAPMMTYCIDLSGPERCMFESNFPSDKVAYSFTVLFNAFKRLTAGYSSEERSALFHDTAARFYRVAI